MVPSASLPRNLTATAMSFSMTPSSKTTVISSLPSRWAAKATDGKAQLTGAVEYSLSAIEKREAGIFLDAYFKQQIEGKANQQVHSNGVNKLSVTNVSANGNAYNATITTNGKIGPKVDESELKDYAKGKRYAEIRSHVEKIEGVSSADVSFSPFWVQSAPNDTNRYKGGI